MIVFGMLLVEHRGRDFQVEARFLGYRSIDYPRPCEQGLWIDVRYMWTPQNGSFRKRIFLKMYTCARSLKEENYTLLNSP